MNSIAFIFKSAPHGNSAGREGLDALLAASSLTENIGVFFIGDGVFQILAKQHPEAILARNYIATFKLLLLYNIKIRIVCNTSLIERGLSKDSKFIFDVEVLNARKLRGKLMQYNKIISF